MGGRALASLGVQRISTAEYIERMAKFATWVEQVNIQHPEYNFRFDFPTTVEGKTDHGDLDILYVCNPDQIDNFFKSFTEFANSRGQKKNGKCRSIEWDLFQIDFIHCNLDTFSWMINWYSHGDYSALLGRVYRYYKLKFADDGLYYTLKVDDQKKDFLLTRDWKLAHAFLAYQALSLDFNYTKEELYQHIASSPYCVKDIWQIMKPDRPRSMQVDGYEYFLNSNIPDKSPVNRETIAMILIKSYNNKIWWSIQREALIMKFRVWRRPYKRLYKKLYHKYYVPFSLRVAGVL